MQVKVKIKDTIIIINNMSRCITLKEILLCLSVCPGHSVLSVLEQIQETWYDTVSRLVWLQSEGIIWHGNKLIDIYIHKIEDCDIHNTYVTVLHYTILLIIIL